MILPSNLQGNLIRQYPNRLGTKVQNGNLLGRRQNDEDMLAALQEILKKKKGVKDVTQGYTSYGAS
ncbi:MAG: hypothetical protein ACE5H1_08695 [Thermodesulfobacteriota bacterium]